MGLAPGGGASGGVGTGVSPQRGLQALNPPSLALLPPQPLPGVPGNPQPAPDLEEPSSTFPSAHSGHLLGQVCPAGLGVSHRPGAPLALLSRVGGARPLGAPFSSGLSIVPASRPPPQTPEIEDLGFGLLVLPFLHSRLSSRWSQRPLPGRLSSLIIPSVLSAHRLAETGFPAC